MSSLRSQIYAPPALCIIRVTWDNLSFVIQGIIVDNLKKRRKVTHFFFCSTLNFNSSSTCRPNLSKWKPLEVGEHAVKRQILFSVLLSFVRSVLNYGTARTEPRVRSYRRCMFTGVILLFVLVADLASQKVSFDSPRHEIYGCTNNSVFYFCPKCSLFLCSVTFI